MNLELVKKEVTSPLLQSLITDITATIEDLQNGRIDFRQAGIEIAGHKHNLQSIALDWVFNKRKIKAIGKVRAIQKSI